MKKKKGFTLIELLAVIVIIAIVLAIAIPRISNYEKDRKKDLFFSVAKNILREIEYENIGSEESLSSILSSIKIDVSSNQIDIDKELALIRRIERDKKYGISEEEIKRYFNEVIMSIYKSHIASQKKEADIILNGGDDIKCLSKKLQTYL